MDDKDYILLNVLGETKNITCCGNIVYDAVSAV